MRSGFHYVFFMLKAHFYDIIGIETRKGGCMYKQICDYYDYIFPQNIKQLEFIESIKSLTKDELVLDVGAATGNLSELISRKARLIGIDLDEGLLAVAKKKYDLDFRKMNMLDIDSLEEQFDRVVSFGNTLVHLENEETIALFFQKVFAVLKDDGYFMVQILNYEKILSEQIRELPLIDNEQVRFIRKYEFLDDKLQFLTDLYIKNEDTNLEGSIFLYPIKRAKIKELLLKTGFKNIEFYSNWHGEKGNGLPLIFSCNK